MTVVDENMNIAPELRAAQGSNEVAVQANYFGFQAREQFTFPDGITYIEFEKMNEGSKRRFQDKTSRDLVVERQSGNARMSVLQGTERHELIKACVTDWNLIGPGGTPIAFTKQLLDQWLSVADPMIVEDLEKAIRKANPWLLAEMTVADIDREIENLQEMREVAQRREEGEGN